MTAADVQRRLIDALNRRDSEAFAALFAPTAVVHDPAYREPLEGRDMIREEIESFFETFPDLQVTPRRLIEAGDTLAADARFTGTHRGPLVTSTGDVPPTGRRVEFDAAGFFQLDGQGRILEENRYYDLAGLAAQLEVSA
jgi:steroid delta-isomerase-like uncharacterized protein